MALFFNALLVLRQYAFFSSWMSRNASVNMVPQLQSLSVRGEITVSRSSLTFFALFPYANISAVVILELADFYTYLDGCVLSHEYYEYAPRVRSAFLCLPIPLDFATYVQITSNSLYAVAFERTERYHNNSS